VTLRSWVLGRNHGTASHGMKRATPLIDPPPGGRSFLSFTNLVEAHVLASMRRVHEIKLHKCRRAIHFMKTNLKVDRPVARETFRTDGVDLFGCSTRTGSRASSHRGLQRVFVGVARERRDLSPCRGFHRLAARETCAIGLTDRGASPLLLGLGAGVGTGCGGRSFPRVDRALHRRTPTRNGRETFGRHTPRVTRSARPLRTSLTALALSFATLLFAPATFASPDPTGTATGTAADVPAAIAGHPTLA
jgi:hypothetical protein